MLGPNSAIGLSVRLARVVSPLPQILALSVPVLAPRFAGETLAGMPGFDVFGQASNYVSTQSGASIVSVQLSFSGVADAFTPLDAGRDVSVAITVEDSLGTLRIFDTNIITVAATTLSGWSISGPVIVASAPVPPTPSVAGALIS